MQAGIPEYLKIFLIITAILVILFVYFVPAIVGWKKRNRKAILVLNLLVGWTVIGWIIALIWALTVDRK